MANRETANREKRGVAVLRRSIDNPESELTERFHWAGAAHCMLAAAERLGVPKAQVLRGAGLELEEIPAAPGRIPWSKLSVLTQAALELTGAPALGLLAGFEATIHFHGVAGAYFMHVSPLRESQALAYREVFPRLSNIVRFWHDESGDLALIRGEIILPEEPLFEPHLHLYLGMHVFGLREVFGQETAVDHISIRSTVIGDADRVSALVRCRVLTGQPADYLAVPRAMLDRHFPLADPWMREQLRPQFQAFLRLLEEGMVATMAVRTALERALARESVSGLEAVAAALGMKPRTVQARLAAEGTSFTAVLDAVRKEFSLRQLSFPGVKLSAVAAQAGFSDGAAFTRAFKRWTGATPKEWQEQRASPGRGGNARGLA